MSDVVTKDDVKIDEKIKKKTELPSRYNVILLNDDVTPIEWVVGVLVEIFKHTEETAKYLTLTIHNDGEAIVGTYTYEIAEQKAAEVVNASRNKGFPLQVRLEQE